MKYKDFYEHLLRKTIDKGYVLVEEFQNNLDFGLKRSTPKLSGVINEVDRIGRTYRLTKKSKKTGKDKLSTREKYNAIKTAQDKAEALNKAGEVTVFHMINLERVARKDSDIIQTLNYLFSKTNEEISVSVNTPIWSMSNSILLIGTTRDLIELYDVDVYTADSTERFPQDVARKKGDLDWDEGIVKVKDVKWESYVISDDANLHHDFRKKVYDFLKNKELNQRFESDLPSLYHTDEQLDNIDIIDKIKEVCSDISDLNERMTRFEEKYLYDFMRKYPRFEDVMDCVKKSILDEYSATEILSISQTEGYELRNEVGKKLGKNDLESFESELSKMEACRDKILDIYEEVRSSMEPNDRKLRKLFGMM